MILWEQSDLLTFYMTLARLKELVQKLGYCPASVLGFRLVSVVVAEQVVVLGIATNDTKLCI